MNVIIWRGEDHREVSLWGPFESATEAAKLAAEWDEIDGFDAGGYGYYRAMSVADPATKEFEE